MKKLLVLFAALALFESRAVHARDIAWFCHIYTPNPISCQEAGEAALNGLPQDFEARFPKKNYSLLIQVVASTLSGQDTFFYTVSVALHKTVWQGSTRLLEFPPLTIQPGGAVSTGGGSGSTRYAWRQKDEIVSDLAAAARTMVLPSKP